jgi:hypothetical protein
MLKKTVNMSKEQISVSQLVVAFPLRMANMPRKSDTLRLSAVRIQVPSVEENGLLRKPSTEIRAQLRSEPKIRCLCG